jgi:uncharacterized protein (UPF0303 family)
VQEARLRFQRFDEDTAFELGCTLRALCVARGIALTIEVRWMRRTVFHHAMPGTAVLNVDWVKRKRNTVELFGRSSYAVRQMLVREGTSLEEKMGLSPRKFAAFGGSFPLFLEGAACVGVVTVSGAPQREDHELVVEALAGLCGVPLEELALGPEV